jgi:hypothetical protein
LAEGAGVADAATFRGEYHFDHVDVRNGASLATTDRLRSGSLSFAGKAGLSGPVEADDALVPAGASVGAAAGQQKLTLSVSGGLVIEEGGAIDVTGQGFAGGTAAHPLGFAPEGVRGSPDGRGGSHGGRGGFYNAPSNDRSGGDPFGSVVAPHEGGGGGGGANGGYVGRPGGGVVDVQAGDIRLDGEIRSSGARTEGASDGGGGGSIWVRSPRLHGTGQIDASGDQTDSCGDTLTGGGRISLHVDDLSAFDVTGQVRAWGNWIKCTWHSTPVAFGGPGTIFIRDASSSYGRLRVDPGAVSGGGNRTPALETELPRLGSSAVSSSLPAGADLWIAASTPFSGAWLGSWMQLSDAAGGDLGTFEVIELDLAGRVRLASAAAASTAATYRGEYRFDRIDLLHEAGLSTQDVVRVTEMSLGTATRLSSGFDTGSLTVQAGVVVRPVLGSSTLSLEARQRLVVEPGARIELSGLGYAAGTSSHQQGFAPTGVRGSDPDAGGSHGGLGEGYTSRGQGKGGEVFGSIVYPTLGGGGGAYSTAPSAGGGALLLRAPEIVLDGEVLARDGRTETFWDQQPRGAGGSVRIEADRLTGSGRIDVSGSIAVDTTLAKPSGGGRVSLLVDEFVGFNVDAQVNAAGGWNAFVSAGAGTVYIRADGAPYGRLILDGGRTGSPTAAVLPTPLPPLGSGSIAAITVVGDETLVESAAGAFSINWPGAWMVLLDGQGAALASFEVLRVDAQGRAVLRGVASIAGVVGYRGEHRFAQVDVRNGAGWAPSSEVRVTSLAVAGTTAMHGTVGAGTLALAANASIVLPSSLSRLDIVAQSVSVPAGAKIDVSGRGYGDRLAPDGVSIPTLGSGGSHGGAGISDGRNGVAYVGLPGEVFDSPLTASWAGGGAASINAGSVRGGGVLTLVADNLVLDGQLLSRAVSIGNSGNYAGAGGSIRVQAGTISGSGQIDASVPGGGLGGGGRIVVEGTSQGFDPKTQTSVRASCSNAKCAAPGTIYFRDGNSTFGSLLVDQQGAPANLVVPITDMPTVGSGSVGEVLPDPADPTDAWVVALDTAHRFGHGVEGAFVRLPSADFRVLAVSGDRRSVLLDGAASTAQVGQAFAGVWKFDAIFVKGRARLQFFDLLEAPLLSVEPGSQLLVP